MKTRIFAMLAFLLAFGASARCQTLADYQFSTGHDASLWYTLDSTRNLLVTGSVYYRTSYLETVGFAFPFADTSYTQFSVTHDGNLRLGSVLAVSGSGNQGSPFFPTRAGTNNPKINFMGCAGYTSDSAYVHKQLFGTAPDRVLVVEFALQTYTTSSRRSLLRWQVQMHENGDIQIVYPSQAPPILPGCNHQQGLCVDETDVWIVDQYHTATHYTNGCSTYIPSGNWPDTNRYYRFEYPDGVCVSPTGTVAAAVNVSSVTLAWRNAAYAPSFAVEYATTAAIAPGTGAGTQVVVSDTFATIAGLQAGVQYHFYVRSICDEGDTSNAAYVVARTLTTEPVSDFPYFCDFESADDRSGWLVPAGNVSTTWFTGTAANNTPQGQYGLYISQDSGATNTGGDDWIGAYAYRDLNLLAGDWNVSFDWRAYGDWFTNSAGATTFYHFMRAFLVPSSVTFTAQTPPSFPSSAAHGTAVPAGWIDLNPATHGFVNQNSWATYTYTVTVPTSGCYHLVFYWETDGYDATTDLPAAIDNVSVERVACAQPQSLAAEVTDDEILLHWNRGGSESLWMVRYGTSEVYTQDTFYLASGLSFNTLYAFEVYAVCGEGDTSFATIGSFSTTAGAPVMQYPYMCDFEDTLAARQWIRLGEGQANQWYVGAAANNTPQGQRALYVSQDNGATNTYSGSTHALSYACRMLVLDTIEYTCSFDWRCLGDNDFHYLRAFIVRADALPTSGVFPMNTTYHHTAVPSGWIDLNPSTHYMSGQSGWTTLIESFSVPDSGLYALLFMWENDDFTPNNPPAAVDNISIAPILCPIPSGLSAEAMQTAVTLTWEAGNDAQIWLVEYADTAVMSYTPSYTATGLMQNTLYQFGVSTLCISGDTSIAATLTVRTSCDAIVSLPYVCDFENYASGTGNDENFIPCWNRIRNYSTFSPKVSDDLTPGNNYLSWNLTAGLLDDVIVVLPELDESIEVTYTELSFKARKYDPVGFFEDPVVVVGVMSDPGSASTFTPVDTMIVANSSEYAVYTVSMLPYVGSDQYVAIRGIVSGTNYASAMLLLDDVELRELQYCRKPTSMAAVSGVDTIALSWTPGHDETQWILSYDGMVLTTQQPSYVARNLQADTEYLFSVAAICSFGDTSEVLTGRFRTQPEPQDPPDTVECPAVTNLGYTQELPWSNHAYEFHFHWSGTADLYEVRIEKPESEWTTLVVTTTDTTYFFDAAGKGGFWICMVRSVCVDGLYGEWSDTVEFETPICIGIDIPVDADGIELYPNPSNGSTTLSLNGINGSVEVTVVDLYGRTVSTFLVDCDARVGELLPIKGLAAGTYFVRISAQSFNTVRKLIVR